MFKKILIGVVIIIAIIIFIGIFSRDNSPFQNIILLEKDELNSFFPRQFSLSQDVKIMDLVTASTNGQIYIEKTANQNVIKIGKQDYKTEIIISESRRSIYRVSDKDPVFKLWVEKISPDYFATYKDKLWEEINGYDDNVVLKKNYENHDYYIYYRADLSNENLKNKNSIGGEYLFFPENNIVVYIYFFNTKFQGCLEGNAETCKFYETEKILNESDFIKIAETIINANKN